MTSCRTCVVQMCQHKLSRASCPGNITLVQCMQVNIVIYIQHTSARSFFGVSSTRLVAYKLNLPLRSWEMLVECLVSKSKWSRCFDLVSRSPVLAAGNSRMLVWRLTARIIFVPTSMCDIWVDGHLVQWKVIM